MLGRKKPIFVILVLGILVMQLFSFTACTNSVIRIEPNLASISVGEQVQFTAFRGSREFTGVSWSVENPAFASIDENTGLLIGLSVGATRVFARDGKDEVAATLAVTRGDDTINFPMLNITMDGTMTNILRDSWRDASFSIGNSDHSIYDITGRIRGRGNSTWHIGTRFGKRPFRIRLDSPQGLLGADHIATDWSFLANYSDRSLIRNYFAKTLAAKIDTFSHTTMIEHVHIFVNGEYRGLYTMVEQMEAIEGRVPLTFDSDPSQSEYLIEMCRRLGRTNGLVEYVDFVTIMDRPDQADSQSFEIRFPDMTAGNGLRYREHTEYAKDFLININSIVTAQPRTTERWEVIRQNLDLNSFADWYLVNELMKNLDAHWSSVFYQIRGVGENRRIHMGPVWDFDQSSGNIDRNTHSNQQFNDSHTQPWAHHNRWIAALLRYPEFRTIVESRWQALQAPLQNTIDAVTLMVLENLADFEKNFTVWDNLIGQRLHPDYGFAADELQTYLEHVRFFLDFIAARRTWMDTRPTW